VLKKKEGMLISQANIQMDNSGKITAENVIRQEGDPCNDPVNVIMQMLLQIKLLQFRLL
jgi:hypothetical protein